MTNAHADNGSGRARCPRWVDATAIGVLAALAGFVVLHLVDGLGIIVAPVVAAAVTGAAMARLTLPGGPPRSDPRDSPGLSGTSRTPSTMLAIGSLLVLVLGACADDGSDSASALPASDPSTGRATSDVCTLAGEMYQQDSLPSVEQLQRYQQLAPDEIAGPVMQVTEALIADGGDPISFFKIIADDDNEAAIAEIDAFEEKTCGIPHSEDTALPDGATRELEPDAARVDVHATDYAFHIGDVAPGRTSFVLTNDGAETHELLIVKLADRGHARRSDAGRRRRGHRRRIVDDQPRRPRRRRRSHHLRRRARQLRPRLLHPQRRRHPPRRSGCNTNSPSTDNRRHDMKRPTLMTLAIAAAELPCSPAVTTSTGVSQTAALAVKPVAMVPPPGPVL